MIPPASSPTPVTIMACHCGHSQLNNACISTEMMRNQCCVDSSSRSSANNLLTCLAGRGGPRMDAAPGAVPPRLPPRWATLSLLGFDAEGDPVAAALAGCVHGPHHVIVGDTPVCR